MALSKRDSFFLLLVASLTLSLVVPLLHGGRESFDTIQRMAPWHMALLIAMVLASWTCNGARLRLLTAGLGLRLTLGQSTASVVAAEFAGCATPAGAGSAPTLMLLLRRRGLDVGSTAGVIAVDVIVDLVFFFTAIPLVLTVYAAGGGLSDLATVSAALVALLGSGLLLLWALMRYHRRLLLWLGRRLDAFPRLARTRYALARRIVHLRRALAVLLRLPPRRLLCLYLFSAGHWTMRYGILPVLLWLLGEDVPWAYSFLAQAILLFGAHVVFLPGGGGGVEIGFMLLMQPFLESPVAAFVLLAWRFCTFYWYLIAGAPVFILLAGRAGRRTLIGRS